MVILSVFLKAVNVIQVLFATFCKHFIGCFILISFGKVNIDLNKYVFKPDGGHFAKSQKVVSEIPLSKSNNHALMFNLILDH